MKQFNNPSREEWSKLCQRPIQDFTQIDQLVDDVFIHVKEEGDAALMRYTEEFDNVRLEKITLDISKVDKHALPLNESLKQAIQVAYNNIYLFHENQRMDESVVSALSDLKCWRETRAIQSVGLYVPGGTAPLFSSLLMLGIPARIAGCEEIVICTPPDESGNVHPAILFVARLLDIDNIYLLGGAQAVAAMSIGTESVPRVDKIFGPGNLFVTRAKLLAFSNGTAIDMPAGPSEVLVIADKYADPEFVAADLLSQAEHGVDSQVVLLSDSIELIDNVQKHIEIQLENLDRKRIAIKALENSRAILLDGIDSCLKFSNVYAPEHLILNIENAETYSSQIINAGSVFIGAYSCESAGDYLSGTNHTLPTDAFARAYSGVSLDSFVKKISFQKIDPSALIELGPHIENMARAEGLDAHKQAVSIRLKKLINGKA